MVIKKYILLIAVFAFAGCGLSLDPMSYIRYMEDKGHGFRKEKVIDHWVYKVQYKTSSYIYIQETKSEKLNRQGMEKRGQELKNWFFFNVYISNDTLTQASPLRLLSRNINDYNTIFNYYINQNKKNIVLYIDSVPIYPTVYNFENNYGLSPEDVFVVGFKLDNALASGACEKMVLEYDDDFLKTGLLRFVFNKTDLKKEPIVAL